MLAIWLRGMLRYRLGHILGTAIGIALAVALLALLGAFLVTISRSMTARSIAGVPVDWQIQLGAGTEPSTVADVLARSGISDAPQTVGYGDVAGFVAHTEGTVQTTGSGRVLGLDPSYGSSFPGQLRILGGRGEGVMLAQQTAASLHATVGDHILIERLSLPPADVRIDGIVALPNADLLFQEVGAPSGRAPQSPPDNVVILPLAQWHTLFDPQAKSHPDSTKVQLHVRLTHDRLSSDPVTALAQAADAARNFEARVQGTTVIADNLAVRLDAVRSDAPYAGVLFLFLGMPGVLLALLVTHSVAVSGAVWRRRQQALLRTRGVSIPQILRLLTLEAGLSGTIGILLGVAGAAAVAALLSGSDLFSRAGLVWIAAAAMLGLGVSAAAILLPALHEARQLAVTKAAAPITLSRVPLWQRLHLDLLCLLLSALLYWQMQRQGYQIVVAPEGVPTTSVDYYAFISPTLLWIAVALVSSRLLGIVINPQHGFLVTVLHPFAGHLSSLAAAALYRQQGRVRRSFTPVLLAMSFATSTAVFDATYRTQAHTDTELTNGADVTVTANGPVPAGAFLTKLAALADVAAAEPMQHRFAYVGSDLQDLYGIDPLSLGDATRMSDAYFQNGDARDSLRSLAETPDGILVSEETVADYQLQPGDSINLRLQSVSDRSYQSVAFRLVGVVREFPTAPRDSFLVANAAYIAQKTGSGAAEIVLLRSKGDPAQLAREVATALGPMSGMQVVDIGRALALVNSSLTAIDLRGLTAIELSFAVLMLLAATGVLFIMNLA